MTALAPQHAAELNGSRISQEIITRRGYTTVGPEERERLVDLGCPAWAVREDDAFPGLIIPMYDAKTGGYTGFQFKPRVPQLPPGKDKPVKYVSPKGMSNRLDTHPAVRDMVLDATRPLWITEGMKKSDAIASLGYATVGLTGVWNWRREDKTLAEWEDIPLHGRTVIVCFDSDAMTNPQVRHAMNRLVAWLRKKTGPDGKVYYLPVPDKVGDTPVKGVDDFLAAGGTAADLYAAATERAPGAHAAKDASFTDAFLTDTVCSEALAGHYLYTGGLGWMRYDGSRWAEVNEAAVVEEIRLWVKHQWEEVLEEHKRDQSREVSERVEQWKRIMASARLKALASLARGALLQDAAAFDAHPDLLNCPNGVVDLRTGELLEPDPAYLMTKVTGASYVPGAVSQDFSAALGALPPEVQGWYQIRMGQAVTGYMTSDDVMVVQQGGGKNGKSTLAAALTRALGSYHVLVSDRVILGNPDQHPTELMDLKGARLALMEETPEARQLNVQQLKKVVGTPQITARRIRQDPVTFAASHSLFVNTNFRPAVAETDYGTWRRLALLTFPYTFRSRPEDLRGPLDRLGDPHLRDRLLSRSEGPQAALAWMVAGAVQWYAHGFPALPGAVVHDTEEWRREGDLILAFADQRLVFEPGAYVKLPDLFQAFGQWLVSTGHKPWGQKTFQARFGGHDRITDRGVVYELRRHGDQRFRAWWNVRVNPDGTDDQMGMT